MKKFRKGFLKKDISSNHFEKARRAYMMEACLWGFYGGWIFELQ